MRHRRWWAIVVAAVAAAGCTIVVEGPGGTSDAGPRAFAQPEAGGKTAIDLGDAGAGAFDGAAADSATGCTLLAKTASWSAMAYEAALGIDLAPVTSDRREYALVAMASPGIVNAGAGYDCQWSYLDARVDAWSAQAGIGRALAPALWPLAIDNGIAALPGGTPGTYAAFVERRCPGSSAISGETCYALIQRDPGDNFSGFRYQPIDQEQLNYQSSAVFAAADGVPATRWLLGYHVDERTVVRVIDDPPLPKYPDLTKSPRVTLGCDPLSGAAAWAAGTLYVAAVAPAPSGSCDGTPDVQRFAIYRYSETAAGPAYTAVYSAAEPQQVLGVRLVADGDALWIADSVGGYVGKNAVLHLRRVGLDGIETLSPVAIPVSWPVPVGCGIAIGAGSGQRPLFRIARASEYLAVLTQVSGDAPLVLRLYDRQGNVYGSTQVAGSTQAYGAALAASPDGTEVLVAVTQRAHLSTAASGIALSRYSVCPAYAP